ncbi:MAG: S9 family peptidase [Candidatus Eremiobacteraeota bacterium]|nr:S9 family peptidase [Candidatus Eremiobacteraeota bacterium]
MKMPLVPSDLYRLALPSDPQCAPDDRVFFTLATPDEAKNETQTSIWSARAGRPAAPFTSGLHDRMPRISPDGAMLSFVGERQEKKKIYVMPLGGGEARALTPSYDAIPATAWSPDGKQLAFVAVVDLDPACAKIAHDETSGARHIRALPFKSDDEGLLDGRRKHLFVVSIDGGEPRRLTFGDFDAGGPAWSPDGSTLAFWAQMGAREGSFVSDIFTIPAGGGEPKQLTNGEGPMCLPSFSHDGREIAFLGHLHGDDVGGRFNYELLVVPSQGGAMRSLSAAVDRPVIDYVICDIKGVGGMQAPIWSGGDYEIFAPLSREAASGIAAFTRDGSAHRMVAGGDRDIIAFSRADDGTLAFVYSTPIVPSEIAVLDPYGSEERLTDCNPWLAERALRAPRRVRPQASDGWTLDLFLLDPVSDKAAPWVLQVHGGPHTAYGFAFSFEFQMLASHGIGVAFGNPRGSQSYGHAYADAITGDWGGLDASDVLTLLDAAEANAAIDPTRIGLAGGSYGGFMTTWLLGHSKRFAAGVSMRAVNDLVSEVGAADLGWFLETEVGAPWTDGGRRLFEGSPMRHAHEIEAPLLVEHSERDYRCPIDQGEQLFTLLRRLGRTSTEFVRFTGDGHNLSRTGKPRNRLLRLRAIAHWFVRYLRPDGIEPVADEAGSLFKPLPTEQTP